MKTILSLLAIAACTFTMQAQENPTAPVKKEAAPTQQAVKAKPATGTAQARALQPADKNLFAGKTFNVIIRQVGQAEEMKDLLTFDHVNFESRTFGKKGFASTKYTSGVNAETHIFEATSESATEGKIVWKGMLKGDKLNGTCIIVKDKQEPVRYTFMGSVVPMVKKEATGSEAK